MKNTIECATMSYATKALLLGVVFGLVFTTFSTLDVQADSLAEKRQQAEWQSKLQSYIQSVATKCGKSIAVELDLNSWKNVPADEQTYSFADYCGNGCVVGVEMVCDDNLGKSAVTEKIDKIVCSYQKGAEANISVANKVMECRFNLSDMQFQQQTKGALEKVL